MIVESLLVAALARGTGTFGAGLSACRIPLTNFSSKSTPQRATDIDLWQSYQDRFANQQDLNFRVPEWQVEKFSRIFEFGKNFFFLYSQKATDTQKQEQKKS